MLQLKVLYSLTDEIVPRLEMGAHSKQIIINRLKQLKKKENKRTKRNATKRKILSFPYRESNPGRLGENQES